MELIRHCKSKELSRRSIELVDSEFISSGDADAEHWGEERPHVTRSTQKAEAVGHHVQSD